MSTPDLAHRFDYHRPDAERVQRHERVREGCKRLALLLDEIVPPGRELASALTSLEQAMFWANAGIARSKE